MKAKKYDDDDDNNNIKKRQEKSKLNYTHIQKEEEHDGK